MPKVACDAAILVEPGNTVALGGRIAQLRLPKSGCERWYVPDAVVIHHHQAVTDRRFFTKRTLWHWRSSASFVRKHPERLKAL